LARHANTLNQHARQPGHAGLFGTPATMAMVGISARWHNLHTGHAGAIGTMAMARWHQIARGHG